jgi:hypothetical protein
MSSSDNIPFLPRKWTTWFNRPSLALVVPHGYWLGGYEIIPNIGLDLDDLGMKWVRTFNFRHVETGIEYRMIEPEDNLHMLTNYDERMANLYEKPGAVV